MNTAFQQFNFRAKAVLCMTLVLAINVIVGCGGSAALFPAFGNTLIQLTPDHPLAQALAGTPYAAATAVELNPSTNQFRLVFPDGSMQVSGTMATTNGETQVKRMTLAQGSKSVTLTFGNNQEITNISTSAGPNWQRTVTTASPQAAQAPRAPSARANNIDAYLAANADLLEVAQQMDSLGMATATDGLTPGQGTSAGQTVKAGAEFWPLAAVFGAMVLIPLGIAATILFILELVVVINVIF